MLYRLQEYFFVILHLMIFAIIQQKYFSCWAIYLWNWTYAATSLFHIWPLSHDYQSNDSHDHYWSVNCQLSYFMLFPIESSHFVWRHILSRLTFKDCHKFPRIWILLAAPGGRKEGKSRMTWKAGEGGRWKVEGSGAKSADPVTPLISDTRE